MKILFLCHRYPGSPLCGGRVRPFHTIKYFAALGHQVTVVSTVRSVQQESDGGELRECCAAVLVERIPPAVSAWNVARHLPLAVPSSMRFFYSSRLQARVDEVLREDSFDLIFVHCSSVAQYVENVRGIPKVLDFGDMDSQKWLEYAAVRRFPLSLGFRLEGVKLRAAEIALARKFDYCTCTTEAELKVLRSYGIPVRSGWFPNGVDGDYFRPQEGPYERNRICFIGRMDYYPNQQAMIDFCSRILPLLRVRRPDFRLFIVGANPSHSVRRLARLPGVAVTGEVADVRPYVLGCLATIAPLAIARGTQNKILESMAMGVPVIASRRAAAGVDAVPGRDLLVAERPQEYCDVILRLAEDPGERERLARAGRARVLSHHDWRKSLDGLTAQLREIVPGFR
jgi:sugar transferase (PEP-CTERM/EpsH1 system associated)